MKNSKAIGSPISQNGRNVNTFSEKNSKVLPYHRMTGLSTPSLKKFLRGS